MSEVSDFCAFLKDAQEILFACHVSPDGDTVGSAVALARLCRALGKRAFVFVPEALPKTLSFLLEDFDNTPFEPRCVVAVDVSSPERLGRDFPYRDRLCAVIDHHENNSVETSCRLVDAHKSATGLLVAEVFDALGQEIDVCSARALYTAISTDTGRFCHSNTTPDVLMLAARLAKIVPEQNFGALNRRLFVEKGARENRLSGYLLSHARTNEQEGYVFFALTRAVYRRFGLDETSDLSALIDVLRSFSGYSLYVLAKESAEERGVYKLSVRSEGALRANAFCAVFGGGGHQKAAGCTLRASSARCLEKRIAETVRQLGKS